MPRSPLYMYAFWRVGVIVHATKHVSAWAQAATMLTFLSVSPVAQRKNPLVWAGLRLQAALG